LQTTAKRRWQTAERRRAYVPPPYTLLLHTNCPRQTLIFTGTLGALRCSAQYAAYGAGRASVRQLAQTLARELSDKGVHVVHSIANGGIADEDGEDQRVGKKMSANAVGETYLWLHNQKPCLWTHELDMRPAGEKF
jgi:NADP-dependent 3-hydroxy acid dehydrogenase YdfG